MVSHTRDSAMMIHDLTARLADQYGLYWNDLTQVDQNDMLRGTQSHLRDRLDWDTAISEAINDWHGQV